MNDDWVPGRQTTIRDALDAQGEDPLVCAEGTVERIVFESQDSGFIVARLQEEGKPYLTTFVGNGLAISPGETIRIWGRCVDDKKFGRQIRVEKYQTVMPATASAIEKYLGSGLIEGIGPTFAKRLVDAFGVETLRIIDEEPNRLRSVEGIGRKRAQQIRTAWEAQKAIQSIMLFLQGHGIGAAQAAKIYKRYGDAAVAVLRDNPYRLADDIAGIAFKSADAIANRLGIEKDSPKRAAAGVLHVLGESMFEGHVFASADALLRTTTELLNVNESVVADAMLALEREQRIVKEEDRVYLPQLHAAETGCALLIKRMLSVPHEPVPIVVERAIEWVQKEFKIQLSPEQKKAIQTACHAKTMIITGGPGTGKTTLLNSLLAIFAKKGLSLILAAPTGRAAKRMSEATGREAKTIHRLLEWSPKAGGFLRNEANPLNADIVVIDETSMVDINLMHSLLKAL
ncbi:MAG: AAA family ATPase, partial [Candidatus Hydrogenedentes bacterium]|nr:AAA family ATPase [Candidatus Hydrogenedentota bacterium]